MGYQKLLLLNNDAEQAIDNDPVGWWRACKEAFYRNKGVFGFSVYANYWQAIFQTHADVPNLVIVKDGSAKVIGRDDLSESEVATLKRVLSDAGFVVYRKKI